MLGRIVPAIVVAAVACGCGTTHTLHVASTPHAPPQQCTIGVKRFMDDTGVDLSFALRDYLRRHGPCRHVILVSGDDDSRADVVVSGSAHADLKRDRGATVVQSIGFGPWFLGGAAIGGGAAAWTEGASGSKEARIGKTLTIAGAAGMVVGGVLIFAEPAIERKMELTGTVDADIHIESSRAALADWSDHDKVVARGRHSADRPESRSSVEAAGTLYPEFYKRIFADISSALADAIRKQRASGRKPGAEAVESGERGRRAQRTARVSRYSP